MTSSEAELTTNPLVEKTKADPSVQSFSLGRMAVRRLFKQFSAIVGMTLLGSLLLIALFAPLIAPYDPLSVLIGKEDIKVREKPCIHALGCPADKPEHIMGIDGNGRDLFSRVLHGTRVSLFIGLTTVTFAIVTGGLLGGVAGYLGGWIDLVIMRLMDVLLAFPALLLAIAIVAVLGPGLRNALLAIGIVSIPAYARLIRSSVLTIKEAEYVEASVALGAGTGHILFRRVLPNALTPLIVAGTLGIATAILDAAALSFLGFGAQPPTPEWGAMLGIERSQMFTAPHLVIFPGIMITLTVLGFNLIGDGLRDALDPRLGATEGQAVDEIPI